MISSSKFHYLSAASELGSMRMASDKLDVAPSSISRQISALEEQLGVDLIERGTRTITLTEAGKLAVKFYREGIASSEAFISEVQDICGLKKGSVTLAIGESYVSDAFISALGAFQNRYPDISLNLDVVSSTDQILTMVANDEAHIGFVLEKDHTDPKIAVHYSISQPIVAVMSSSHALASRASVSLEDLSEVPLGLPKQQLQTRQLLEQAAAAAKVNLQPEFTSNSLLLLKKFTQCMGGVAVLPRTAVWGETSEGSLCAKEIESEVLNVTSAYIVKRRGRKLPVAAKKLLDEVVYILRSL